MLFVCNNITCLFFLDMANIYHYSLLFGIDLLLTLHALFFIVPFCLPYTFHFWKTWLKTVTVGTHLLRTVLLAVCLSTTPQQPSLYLGIRVLGLGPGSLPPTLPHPLPHTPCLLPHYTAKMAEEEERQGTRKASILSMLL